MSVELKVGQVWKDRKGREVTIAKKANSGIGFQTVSKDGEADVYESGTYWNGFEESQYDLIELVQDESGWRPWVATEDSECPVSPQTIVRVRGKSGSGAECKAGNLYWYAGGDDKMFDPLVAYKVIKEASKTSEPSAPQRTPSRHSHYFKDVSQISEIDVYRVCDLFGVDDPSGATHHAVKKLLCAGRRGAKDRAKDYQEAIER